jgi:hypothetical protein
MLTVDLFHVDRAVTRKRIYIFFVREVGSRYVHILGATSHPTRARTTQQARNLLRAGSSRGRGLGEPEIADLSLLHEGSIVPTVSSIGTFGVVAVLVVQIDVVHPPAGRATGPQPRGCTPRLRVPALGGIVRVADDAELGRQHDFLVAIDSVSSPGP